MDIITKIIEFILQFLTPASPEQENWFNPEDTYKEKDSLENSKQDEIEETVSAIIFCSPVEDDVPHVTSKHGYRTLRGKKVWHSGVDLRAKQGSGCIAVEDSLIVETVGLKAGAPCRFKWLNGKWIDLNNGSITPRIVIRGKYTGNLYFYKHAVIDSRFSIGKAVKAGNKIGHYGNYGYSMGSHCHFEYWTPKREGVKYTKDYRNDFKQRDPVKMMKKEFGLSFTGKV